MTKVLNITLAALLTASTFGASTALAAGDYYVGGSPDAVKSQAVDQVRTNSIGDKQTSARGQSVATPYDHGDYRSVAPGANN